MNLPGRCLTTAMGILPHDEIDKAMELAFSVDIPFWPQLPWVSFYEDMYVQTTENFPGITLDIENKKINFTMDRFYEDIPEYLERAEDPNYFALTGEYSAVYHRFIESPGLDRYPAIRGQNIGPISFGLKISDENKKPIIYNDELKAFLYEFIANKINVQYRELTAKNPNAFVWVDEPGLSFLFGSFTGYSSSVAKDDFRRFLLALEGPKGVHLCGNPDWSFLLSGLDLDILSMDIFGNGEIFVRYSEEIKAFLERGAIISWGIVPTLTEELTVETVATLQGKLISFWEFLDHHGIPMDLILDKAWLAPARCCLVNADRMVTVEKAFTVLKEIAAGIKARYNL